MEMITLEFLFIIRLYYYIGRSAPLPQATTLDHTPNTQRHNALPSRPNRSKRRRLT